MKSSKAIKVLFSWNDAPSSYAWSLQWGDKTVWGENQRKENANSNTTWGERIKSLPAFGPSFSLTFILHWTLHNNFTHNDNKIKQVKNRTADR